MANNIDLSYLQEISGGDSSFIKEMLELYVNTTAQEASLFPALLSSGDINGIGNLAHKMKAPIQMLGANELFNVIRNLEQIGKNGQPTEEIEPLIEKAQELVNLSIEEIHQILGTL
jgi:HPt (histidine-containing phosphotransfer) domain-containing protein